MSSVTRTSKRQNSSGSSRGTSVSRPPGVNTDNLIPYPAAIETTDNEIRIRVLDFDDVAGIGICHESAVKSAQDALLRKLMTMMRGADEIPEPDQYLENVCTSREF